MSVSSGETQPVEVGPPPYYHRSDCNICRKQDGLKTGSVLLDVPVPGGYIVEREHFLAEHAPLQESSAGTVILEARRHVLDFGEMTPAELAEFVARVVGHFVEKRRIVVRAALPIAELGEANVGRSCITSEVRIFGVHYRDASLLHEVFNFSPAHQLIQLKSRLR